MKTLPIAAILSLLSWTALLGSSELLAAEFSAASVDSLVDSALLPDTPKNARTASNAPIPNTATGGLVQGIAKQSPAKALNFSDQRDKKAKVIEVKGSVKISKNSGEEWNKLKKDQIIEVGDIVLTGRGDSASITFDGSMMNVIRLTEKTRAQFKNIEPNDIFLEDGTIYSLLDALPQDAGFAKVSTPTAVAAVRGTHFVVHFTSLTGHLTVATFEVKEDGKESAIELKDVLPDGGVGNQIDIPEGRQIYLTENETPDPSQLSGIDPVWIDAMQKILEQIEEKREEAGGLLPATGGENGEAPDSNMDSIAQSALPQFDPVADFRPDLNLNPIPEPSAFGILGKEPPDDTQEPPPVENPEYVRFQEVFNADALTQAVDQILRDMRDDETLSDPEQERIRQLFLNAIVDNGFHGALEAPDIHEIYHEENPGIDENIHESVHQAAQAQLDALQAVIQQNVADSSPAIQQAAETFVETFHDHSLQESVEAAKQKFEEVASGESAPADNAQSNAV